MFITSQVIFFFTPAKCSPLNLLGEEKDKICLQSHKCGTYLLQQLNDAQVLQLIWSSKVYPHAMGNKIQRYWHGL